jgi:hypothetical protein
MQLTLHSTGKFFPKGCQLFPFRIRAAIAPNQRMV